MEKRVARFRGVVQNDFGFLRHFHGKRAVRIAFAERDEIRLLLEEFAVSRRGVRIDFEGVIHAVDFDGGSGECGGFDEEGEIQFFRSGEGGRELNFLFAVDENREFAVIGETVGDNAVFLRSCSLDRLAVDFDGETAEPLIRSDGVKLRRSLIVAHQMNVSGGEAAEALAFDVLHRGGVECGKSHRTRKQSGGEKKCGFFHVCIPFFCVILSDSCPNPIGLLRKWR